jgi:hypothetical protein
MAKKVEHYEIVKAWPIDITPDTELIEAVAITTSKEYRALTDRTFEMNIAMSINGIDRRNGFYGIRRAASDMEQSR